VPLPGPITKGEGDEGPGPKAGWVVVVWQVVPGPTTKHGVVVGGGAGAGAGAGGGEHWVLGPTTKHGWVVGAGAVVGGGLGEVVPPPEVGGGVAPEPGRGAGAGAAGEDPPPPPVEPVVDAPGARSAPYELAPNGDWVPEAPGREPMAPCSDVCPAAGAAPPAAVLPKEPPRGDALAALMPRIGPPRSKTFALASEALCEPRATLGEKPLNGPPARAPALATKFERAAAESSSLGPRRFGGCSPCAG
jgi:hypothetical protein